LESPFPLIFRGNLSAETKHVDGDEMATFAVILLLQYFPDSRHWLNFYSFTSMSPTHNIQNHGLSGLEAALAGKLKPTQTTKIISHKENQNISEAATMLKVDRGHLKMTVILV
jgi:hypothetical protein